MRVFFTNIHTVYGKWKTYFHKQTYFLAIQDQKLIQIYKNTGRSTGGEVGSSDR